MSRIETWTAPVAANSSVDFLNSDHSIVSRGIDTQDLKAALSDEREETINKAALGVRSNLPADQRKGLRLNYVHLR